MRSIGQGVQELEHGMTHRIRFFVNNDLDLDPMTFISELDLDIIVTYLQAKNEVNRSSGSGVRARNDTQTHRQTDRQTDMSETITYPLRGR